MTKNINFSKIYLVHKTIKETHTKKARRESNWAVGTINKNTSNILPRNRGGTRGVIADADVLVV